MSCFFMYINVVKVQKVQSKKDKSTYGDVRYAAMLIMLLTLKIG